VKIVKREGNKRTKINNAIDNKYIYILSNTFKATRAPIVETTQLDITQLLGKA